tara:strand:- start:240 stop:593 length:354 start_codon:yes stop_codon:yes gene_type:complete
MRNRGGNTISFSNVCIWSLLAYRNILIAAMAKSRSPRSLRLGNQNQCSEERWNTYPAMGYRVSQIRPKRSRTTNKRSVRTISLVRRTIKVDIRYFLRSKQMTRIQENVGKSMTYGGG